MVVPSSYNTPPPATAPGLPSQGRKQTREKGLQGTRDMAAEQVKARRKIERQEAMERMDMKGEDRRKAHNAK